MAKCKQCNGDYEPKRATSQYCSKACKQTSYRNRGKDITVTPVALRPVTVTDNVTLPPEPVTVTAKVKYLVRPAGIGDNQWNYIQYKAEQA